MYFLFDLDNSVLSCISLADDRHFYYFQGNSIFSSLVIATLFCFISLSAFCLTFYPVYFLLLLSAFFSFLSAFCYPWPLYACTHFLFSSCFLLLFVLCVTMIQLPSAFLCFQPFYAGSTVVCLLFDFFFNLLSPNLFFSKLLHYLLLIHYCYPILLVLLWQLVAGFVLALVQLASQLAD